MQKIALSDETKDKLKATGKVVALGGMGAAAGTLLGSRFAGTKLGNKIFSSRLMQGAGKMGGLGADVSKAKSAFGKAKLSSKPVAPAAIGALVDHICWALLEIMLVFLTV